MLEKSKCLECGVEITVIRISPHFGDKPTGIWLIRYDENCDEHNVGCLCHDCVDKLFEANIISLGYPGKAFPNQVVDFEAVIQSSHHSFPFLCAVK